MRRWILRLNAVTILFGAVLAAAFPAKVKHEALSLTGPVPAPLAAVRPASFPEFVSLVNLSEFLLAVEANASASPDARKAAEELSAKFAGPMVAQNSDSETAGTGAGYDPIAPVASAVTITPETPLQVAALSEEGSDVLEPEVATDAPVVELAPVPIQPVKLEAIVKAPKAAPSKPVTRPKARSAHRGVDSRAKFTKQSLQRQPRRRGKLTNRVSKSRPDKVREVSAFDRLIGFVGLGPDPMLSN
jgi:hypothetical protein